MSNYTPGIPSTASIKDADTRRVLDAVIQGWKLRNGELDPKHEQRFITKAELKDLTISTVKGWAVTQEGQSTLNSGPGGLSESEINDIIGYLTDSVTSSKLWRDLGEKIELIDIPQIFSRIGNSEIVIKNTQTSLKTETEARITSDNALGVRVGNNEAGLTNEVNLRTNSDNALASAVNKLWATVGNNTGLVSSGSSITANVSGAVATNWNQVQTTIKDPLTGAYVQTAVVRDTLTAEVNKTKNVLTAEKTVKIDLNGYVTGYGLIANQDMTTGIASSEFLVRADRFAIGSVGQSKRVPFVVLTATDANGTPPGVYMDNAVIKTASLGTLFLGGEAVTITRYADGAYFPITLTTSATTLGSITLNITGLPTGATASVIFNAFINYSPADTSAASVYSTIYNSSGGAVSPLHGVTVIGGATFAGNSALVQLPNGAHTYYLKTFLGGTGATSKDFVGVNYIFTAQTGKR